MADAERLLLELEGGGGPPAELPRAGVLVVGRSKERAGFVVEGSGVADVHCAIGRTKGGGWAIRDLGSAAGTQLNGQKVESARLQHGDRIEVGSQRLRIVDPKRNDATIEPHAPVAESHKSAPKTPDAAGTSVASGTTGTSAGPATPVPTTTAKPATSRYPASAVPGSVAPQRTDESSFTRAGAAPSAPSIPGYRVEKLLGRGGMGHVWLAVQTSLDRRVALKVLAARLEADAEFVRRFQAEARAAAALNHPNVVTVYDVGEEHGTHYLSMEYMDCGNLEDRVTKVGRIAWRETLDILRDAASGLVYAEARKIVHRDIKPANLMQNHVGATKIADLGLATHVEVEERQTADKKIFGTPHFMSPEQARGERVDSRSDLYSLGATAYRLLTGHTPHEGATSRDILRALLRDEPRPMRDFITDLPDDVVALVTRLMRKEPAERFASAHELLREVERLRTRAGASAGAAAERTGSGRRIAAVLVLLALAGGGWWLLREREARAERDAARAARELPAGSGAPAAAPEVVVAEPASAAGKPQDDEKALELLEANARVKYLEVLSRDMPPKEKRDELRLLAVRFRGTSAATEANTKADEIEAAMASTAQAETERAAQVADVSARLRAAAQLDVEPPQPKAALEAIRLLAGGEGDAGKGGDADPVFAAARKEVELAVTHRAATHARAVLDETQRDLQAGRFDEAQRKLEALMPLFDLPDYPMGQGPPGLSELFELGRGARERLSNLALMRGVFATKQAREDAVAIASAFRGEAGLEREIAGLDLAAARARLETLTERLSTPGARDWVGALAGDLARAQGAFDTLAREYAAGGWRRKGIDDPRDKKNALRNAVGADAGGLLYESEGGAVERVPWSAFGGNAKELSKLFVERLSREYTPEEARAIAALVRVTCVVEALDLVAKMFEHQKRANFTEANSKEVLECFAPAQQWGAKADLAAPVARELEAAELLTQGLARATEGAWSVAVTSTERLLAEYQDTLLVRLLSDGTPAVAEDPATK